MTVEGAVEGKAQTRKPLAQLLNEGLVADGAGDAGLLGDGVEVHLESFQLVVFGGDQYPDGFFLLVGCFVRDEAQRAPEN